MGTTEINGKRYVERWEYYDIDTENRNLKRTLEHRDTVLSIMYDLVRNCNMKTRIKLLMIKSVIDVEVWKDIKELTPMEKVMFDRFWERDF